MEKSFTISLDNYGMKIYIKPEMEISILLPEKMIATSIFIDVEQEEEGEAEAIEIRRGVWGNLWIEPNTEIEESRW